MRGIWLAEEQSASQEGLCFMEIINDAFDEENYVAWAVHE
jgi:hypothetical protein